MLWAVVLTTLPCFRTMPTGRGFYRSLPFILSEPTQGVMPGFLLMVIADYLGVGRTAASAMSRSGREIVKKYSIVI
jgi:hypothetical protein